MRRRLGLHALAAFVALAAAACSVRDDVFAPLGATVSFELAESLTDESIVTVPILVRLSEPVPELVTARYAVAAGTAIPGNDLLNTSGEVTFAPLAVTAMIELVLIDDGIEEVEEDVLVELQSPQHAALGELVAHRLRIADNDGNRPAVRFDPITPDRAEAERNVSSMMYAYRVALSAASSQQVTVSVMVGGTAQANDYSIDASEIPVVFAPGQTVSELRFTVTADTNVEPNETITLTLGATSTNGTNAADNQLRTHTIINDD